MADEVAVSSTEQVAEASPATAESPAGAGLGANEAAKPETAERASDAYAKLQSERDRLARQLSEARESESRLQRLLGAEAERADFRKLMESAPDPRIDPEGFQAYVYRAHGQVVEARERQRVEQERERQTREQVRRESTRFVNAYLAEASKRAGVSITREHPDVIIQAGGEAAREAFMRSVDSVVDRAIELREAHEARQKAEEALKAAGVDRFDGGSTAGGAGRRTFTPAEIKRMSIDEYRQHRTAILAGGVRAS